MWPVFGMSNSTNIRRIFISYYHTIWTNNCLYVNGMQDLWLTIISLQKPWLKPKAIAKRHRGGIYTAAIIKSGKNKLWLTPTKGCQTRVCQIKYIACSNTSVWHYYEQKRSGALSPLSILFVIRWHRSKGHSPCKLCFMRKRSHICPIEIA